MNVRISNRIFIAILFSSSLIGCNKISTTIQQNRTPWDGLTATERRLAAMVFDSSTVHNCFVLTYSEMTGYAPKYDVGYGVYFTDSVTNNQIGFTAASVNGMALTLNADSSYSYKYPDSSSQAASVAGSTLSVRIAGTSNVDSVTEAVYVPAGIVASAADFPGAGVVNNQSLTLKWNPDPNCSWGHVMIEISYLAGLSHLSDPSLPANVDSLVIMPVDNGTYTISASQINAFPLNSYITIAIGRGTQQKAILPLSHKAVFYFSIVEARTGALKVTRNIQ